jgi:hypothetical protein
MLQDVNVGHIVLLEEREGQVLVSLFANSHLNVLIQFNSIQFNSNQLYSTNKHI